MLTLTDVPRRTASNYGIFCFSWTFIERTDIELKKTSVQIAVIPSSSEVIS